MGFFERNRRALEDAGIDPARLPPGQYRTDRFPVLHVGEVPAVDLASWRLVVDGLVERPLSLSYEELRALPSVEVVTDIHCVTKWSKLDTAWRGVPLRHLWDLAGALPAAGYVVEHAEGGYTTNLPLEATVADDCLLAYDYEGEPLEPEHGFPARVLVPQRYFWKSAKWVRRLELVEADEPGFWERNGYHNDADPFLEQRHWGD